MDLLQALRSHGGQKTLAPRWPPEVAVDRHAGAFDPRYTVVWSAVVFTRFVFNFVGGLFIFGIIFYLAGVYGQ